jgi:hypothetical protein
MSVPPTFSSLLASSPRLLPLAKPYRNTPFSNKGSQLLKMTEKDYVNSYEGDISMIDKWADFLDLSKWFEWMWLEDVPQDYLNSV